MSRHYDLTTSVGKALALLDAFDLGTPSLGVTELARRAGIPKSTAFRLLATLCSAGYLERRGTQFSLGSRLFELGNQVAHGQPRSFRDLALPHLCDLYETSHETVHLAVLDGSDVVYLVKLFGHRQVASPSKVGGRVPAHASALGKALLAYSDPAAVEEILARPLERLTPYTIVDRRVLLEQLHEIRRDGVAFDREESRLGLTCVSAPIMRQAHAVASISVSGPTTRFEPAKLASAVRNTAARIALEVRGPPGAGSNGAPRRSDQRVGGTP